MKERLTRESAKKAAVLAMGTTALGLFGHAGGVAATNLVPAHVETSTYTADASLSLMTDKIAISSTFGNFDLQFDGVLPAQGVTVTPRLSGGVIDSYAHAGARGVQSEITSSVPAGQEKLVTELAIRYGAGVAAAELIALGLLSVGARSVTRRRGLAALVAGGLALGYQGVSSWQTYNSEHYRSYTATGLAESALKRGTSTLNKLNERADQLQPFVSSWVALEKGLNEKLVSPERQRELTGPRFLLISDEHGINMTAMVKQLAEESNVDAIINTGDFLNLGSPNEDELTHFLEGIASIGKPYIVVLGNHDRSSPTDTSFVDRLKKIPNVIILQPTGDTFTVVHVGDLRIAGVNDFMRWFGDSNTDNTAKQQPVIKLFNDTFADNPPGLSISHEPNAARELVTEGMQMAGHYHVPSLDKKLIINGTLTGGGLFGQSDSTDPEHRSPTQSYAVLVFDSQCQPAELNVTQFTDSFGGNPTATSFTQYFLGPTRTTTANRSCIDHTVSTEVIPAVVAR